MNSFKCLILLLFFVLNQRVFSMEIASHDEINPDLHVATTSEEALTLALDIFDKSAREFRMLYQLSLDAALALLELPTEFSTTQKLSEELVDEAFHWMGGAINYGVSEGYPDGARQDKRFQALHLIRAATYYSEWYSTSRVIYLALQKYNSCEFRTNIVQYLESLVASAIKKYDENIQTDAQKIQFGEFPPFDYKGMVVGPYINAISYINQLIKLPEEFEIKENYCDVSAIIDDLGKASLEWDAEFYKITNNFCAFQLVKNDRNCRFQKFEDGALENAVKFFLCLSNASRRNDAINRFILSKIPNVREFFKNIDESILKSLDPKNAVSLEPNSAETISDVSEQEIAPEPKRAKKGKKKGGKKRTKGKKVSRPTNKKPVHAPAVELDEDSEEEDLPDGSEVVESSDNDTVLDKNTETNVVDKKNIDKTPVKKANKREKKATKKTEKALQRKITRLDAHAQRAPLLVNLGNRSVEYFTREVVEKFLDVFGNKLGAQRQKAQNTYQNQGWGKSNDFVATLKSAGWLVDKKQIAGGLVVNEKHSSSTMSFQMPIVEGVPTIYIKFHADHENNLDMREIARHFIIKALEDAGYPEQFWQDYHARHFQL